MTIKFPLSRRQFVRNSGIASIGLPLFGLGASGCGPTVPDFQVPPNVIADIQRPPLAMAMWDFSWLTRRSGIENEYADFDVILDEFNTRGYDCIRLDAFPHLIANDADGNSQASFTMLAQSNEFMWGNHTEVTINPRQDLIVFMEKCRNRGIRLGLSTWFQADTSHREQQIVTPADMARVWIETLDWIASNDLLDVVEWVDMCNEFPVERWAPAAINHINQSLQTPISELNPAVVPFTQEQADRISEYMNATILAVKQVYPDQRYCFSFQAAGHAVNYSHFDLSSFDCLEPHIWLSQNQDFLFQSGQLDLLLEIPGAIESAYPKSDALYYNKRQNWLDWLDEVINSWAHLANQWQLPLYTSEAWGPINYQDLPDNNIVNDEEWHWVFDVCETSIGMAKAHGWTGICSANFCQPHHPGFYQNILWHQDRTALIKTV